MAHENKIKIQNKNRIAKEETIYTKLENKNTKPTTEIQKLKQNHKLQNGNAKLKQNHKIENRNTKLTT